MFKKRRGINIPYSKQGDIYFTCLNYRDKPPEIEAKMRRLCDQIGGTEYKHALWRVVSTDQSIRTIAMETYISEPTLYRLRQKFYEAW